MKPQDFTRFTQDNEEKWLYNDITEQKQRKLSFEPQKELDIWYKDLLIPRKYTPDLVVEDGVIVEIKATSGLTNNDEAQLLNYLKATKKRVGLLLNFGARSLEIKRKIL